MSIHVNDRFEIRRDSHCWILVEHVKTDQTRKNVKRAARESHTFHANVRQCCAAILERTGGDCETAEGLIEAWDRTRYEICKAANSMAEEI